MTWAAVFVLASTSTLVAAPEQEQDTRAVEPSARHHHRAAWDRERDTLVLFGGSTDDGWATGTWEWAGGNWTQQPVDGPPDVASNALVYDPARGVTLLFGGVRADRTLSGDTWLWTGEDWIQHAGDGPSPRHSPAIGYDEKRERVVVFGGSGRGSDALWEWDGEWHAVELGATAPPPLMRAGFAYDPRRKSMLLFGGYAGEVHGETWSWDGTA